MRIPVVISSDENIFFSVGVVIESLAEHAAEGTFYDIRVFCAENVTAESKAKLGDLAKRHAAKLSVNCVDMGGAFADINKTHAYVNHVSAWKMLIAEKLPDCDKALYLDTDLIVRADLSALYAADISGNYLGGVPNMLNQITLREKISVQAELPEMDGYINAGVLLFNLAAIRRDGIAARWQKLLGRFEGSVDQHILNHVCRGRIAFLPLTYNVCLSNLDLYKNGAAHIFYSPKVCREAYEDPAIFHFSLRSKPWDYYDLPFAHEWFRYFAKTPFFRQRERKMLYPKLVFKEPPKNQYKGIKKIGYRLWKHLNKTYGEKK